MEKGIFVFTEIFQGEISDISFEIHGFGREIADKLGKKLVTILLGKDVKNLVSQFGISDKVFVVDDEKLENFTPDLYQETIRNILSSNDPTLVLLGHTAYGMDLGGYLSVKMNIPLVAFCNGVRVENGEIYTTSFVYGGKILVESKLKEGKAILLVMSGSSPADKGKVEKTPEVEELSLPEVTPRVNFEKYTVPEIEDIDITKEEILVAVGRGIENQDNVPMAEELAESLRGAVAASRPVIDQGWLPLTRQVGRSGKIVKPKVYIALGISGAPEHVEGMKDSGLIIAINKDPKAPIFNVAHYGIVGDIFDILPQLVEELKSRK